MTFSVRTFAVAAFALGLTCQAATTRADTFDWNNLTYAPSTTNPAGTPVPNGRSTSGNNSLSTQLVLGNGAAYYTGVASPAVSSNSVSGTYASGGNADNTQKSLQIAVDFANNTQFVTVTVFFAQPVINVGFSFFDVDSGTTTNNGTTGGYIDQVRSIQGGTAQNPNLTTPTLTPGSVNTVSGNAVTARANNPIDAAYTNAQNAAAGNVGVQFGSTPITQFSFVYGDVVPSTAAHSAVQIIALSNITFAPVPEPGTLAMLGLGVFGAAGIAFRRRN